MYEFLFLYFLLFPINGRWLYKKYLKGDFEKKVEVTSKFLENFSKTIEELNKNEEKLKTFNLKNYLENEIKSNIIIKDFLLKSYDDGFLYKHLYKKENKKFNVENAFYLLKNFKPYEKPFMIYYNMTEDKYDSFNYYNSMFNEYIDKLIDLQNNIITKSDHLEIDYEFFIKYYYYDDYSGEFKFLYDIYRNFYVNPFFCYISFLDINSLSNPNSKKMNYFKFLIQYKKLFKTKIESCSLEKNEFDLSINSYTNFVNLISNLINSLIFVNKEKIYELHKYKLCYEFPSNIVNNLNYLNLNFKELDSLDKQIESKKNNLEKFKVVFNNQKINITKFYWLSYYKFYYFENFKISQEDLIDDQILYKVRLRITEEEFEKIDIYKNIIKNFHNFKNIFPSKIQKLNINTFIVVLDLMIEKYFQKSESSFLKKFVKSIETYKTIVYSIINGRKLLKSFGELIFEIMSLTSIFSIDIYFETFKYLVTFIFKATIEDIKNGNISMILIDVFDDLNKFYNFNKYINKIYEKKDSKEVLKKFYEVFIGENNNSKEINYFEEFYNSLN